eukprot:COSAG01_NODE_4502_length_4970_cov_587.236707_3_plen_133_part_00
MLLLLAALLLAAAAARPCSGGSAMKIKSNSRDKAVGYQRMWAVMSDHKEGCRQGARLPATRQRAQGYCNQLGRSGRPGGPRRAAARGVHALGFACMPACCARRRGGGLPGMHWDLPAWLAGWLLIVPPIDLP